MVAKHHENSSAPFSFYYVDSDNDRIDLSEDEDLLEAARYKKMKGLANLEVMAEDQNLKSHVRSELKDFEDEIRTYREVQASVNPVVHKASEEGKMAGAEEAMRE